VFALVVLGVTVLGSLRVAMSHTGGHLVYAVDDAYIHLAMARTLAESGVWGISPAQPAFASSSPGWTILLAALYAIGLRGDWVPAALNVASAVALLTVADRAARRLMAAQRARIWLLLALIFVTPIPALVLTGMEALLQVTLVLAFVGAVARVLARRDDDVPAGSVAPMLLLAAAMVTLRYESLFVAAGAVLVLAWRRHIRLAAEVAAAAWTPAILYAAFSLAHGGWWLPTSVVLKSQPLAPSWGGFLSFMADKGLPALMMHWPLPPILIGLLIVLVALTYLDTRLEGEAEAWMLVVTLAVLLHIHFVNVEWMYRYRAYLVASGLCAIAFGFWRAWREWGSALRTPPLRAVLLGLLALALAGPLALTSYDALSRGPRASRSVFLQQYQMARFLAEQGTGAVALNDIGAVAYFTRRPIVDLVGLGDQRIAVARHAYTFDSRAMDVAVRAASADVAVIYEEWFRGQTEPPSTWVPVGRWTTADAVSVASPTVTFYATRAGAAERLRASVAAWTRQLPEGVTVELSAP
jgi:hypothetical protein